MTEQYPELLERVASIQKAIVGPGGAIIREAEAYPPSDISRYQVPFFINEIEGGSVKITATQGMQFVHSVLHMHLCIGTRGSSDLKYLVQEALKWRNYVMQAFANRLRLGNDLAYILVTPVVAWDVVDYEYGSSVYLALKCDLDVTEAFILTVAP